VVFARCYLYVPHDITLIFESLVVTICTTHCDIKKLRILLTVAAWLSYRRNQTAIVAINMLSWLVLTVKTDCVYLEVRTRSSCMI